MLIETIPAAFEMDEILYERATTRPAQLCWDYIFSIIKKFRGNPTSRSPIGPR